jgi:hypothetical protein
MEGRKEEWKNGRMEDWKGWKIGRVEGWNQRTYKLENGLKRLIESLQKKRLTGSWDESFIIKERNGERAMEEWKDGRLGGWKGGRVTGDLRSIVPLFHSSNLPPFHPSTPPAFNEPKSASSSSL